MITTTTNVHVPTGETLTADARLIHNEGMSAREAFVVLEVGARGAMIQYLLDNREALEAVRAAVAKADDLLAQVHAARAVEAMPTPGQVV